MGVWGMKAGKALLQGLRGWPEISRAGASALCFLEQELAHKFILWSKLARYIKYINCTRNMIERGSKYQPKPPESPSEVKERENVKQIAKRLRPLFACAFHPKFLIFRPESRTVYTHNI